MYGIILSNGGGQMDFDFYGNAVQEYLAEFEENTRRVLKKIKIPQAEIELQIQDEKEKIEKLISTNKEYAKLLMDLRVYQRDNERRMVSLTQFAKRKNESNPGYVIQSWLRDRNTLEFLRIWEKEHNSHDFNDEAAKKLIEKTHEPSFTLTAKVWIAETNARGIESKQGSNGGTFAVEQIAVDFITWLCPERRYELIKLISKRVLIDNNQLIL